ncbi:hypothetical protein HGRIS_002266 [Hohenbuehelia grisea]|uniref:HbrB-domain-containing protein n=1 Tax=Hohenbuehelia grisea TaxID=104357 RepID=A0ABR3JK63_9AGAR
MMSGWASAYTTSVPRRSHDQYHADMPDASSPDQAAEPRRRSSSDATPRPTPAPSPRMLMSGAGNNHDPNRNILTSDASTLSSATSSSRRLGFLAEKLSSSLSPASHSSSQRTIVAGHSNLLQPHSHSRADLSLSPSREQVSSPLPPPLMASSSSMSTTSKIHTSPSKSTYGRTYDSKLVSREMHRLGNLAHMPAGHPSTLSPTPSSSSTITATTSSMTAVGLASASSNEPWAALHVHVLPLFNGEPLRIPIEDLNVLVKSHVEKRVSSPHKAIASLESDTSDLIASGMLTLNAKLSGIDEDKMVGRVAEIWNFFWDQVLPYVEGALLPLQTDPMLSSLYRTHKPHRTGSENAKSSLSSSLSTSLQMSAPCIDVRSIALRSFRDKVILPLSSRLYNRLGNKQALQETAHYQPRLQQMFLVLASQSRQRPPSFSLTKSAAQPTAGESAILDLLRVVRSPGSLPDRLRSPNPRALGSLTPQATFLHGALPRDRRGRIAQKKKGKAGTIMAESGGEEDDVLGDGAETPRNGFGLPTDAEREAELLEALRSPDPENTSRVSMGGWGLGAGKEYSAKQAEIDDDEPLDWDQAQAVVEAMVGMNPGDREPTHLSRRRAGS